MDVTGGLSVGGSDVQETSKSGTAPFVLILSRRTSSSLKGTEALRLSSFISPTLVWKVIDSRYLLR